MASGRAASSVKAWRSSTLQVGADAAGVVRGGIVGAHVGLACDGLEHQQWLALAQVAAGHREQPGHAAGVRGGQHVLHLHGLEHGQLGARGHLVALGHAQLHQARGHGGHDGVGGRIGDGF
jgi:hypothetical protein